MGEGGSKRPRVLLLEDEGGVALLIEDMLEELGCEVVESAARLSRAVEAARKTAIDLAVLDVNVGGETSFDFARQLGERGIPFLFSTGYGDGGIPDEFRDRPVVGKPFAMSDLRKALTEALEPRRDRQGN